jgi:eukaryotic-like serine/threonine-protein kinase
LLLAGGPGTLRRLAVYVSETTTVGRYVLYNRIGAGGTAAVHLGRLLASGGFSRTVAIKRLHPWLAADPVFAAMLLDEARLAARITHSHVVPILDVVSTSGELFLVLEYVPGESLSSLVQATMDRGARIPLPVAVAIVSGLLHGLSAAHEARDENGVPLGIVHRDISPQNVLVGIDGHARIIDFGIAKAAGRLQTTQEGQLKGKLRYMAPEQLRDEAVSPRTDIYAATVVLWELLTSKRLFGTSTDQALVAAILMGEATMPGSIASARVPGDPDATVAMGRLDEVVRKGLDHDPSRRFASAHEMLVALEHCVTPATPAVVAEWLLSIAGPSVQERAMLVAEIERRSLPSEGFASKSAESIATEPTYVRDRPAAPAPRVRKRRLLLGLVAASIAGVVVFVALRAVHGGVSAEPVAQADAHVDLVLVPVETRPPASPPSAEAEAAMPPPAAHTPRRSRPRAVADPSAPTSRCDPPFVWDDAGTKRYKPECM